MLTYIAYVPLLVSAAEINKDLLASNGDFDVFIEMKNTS